MWCFPSGRNWWRSINRNETISLGLPINPSEMVSLRLILRPQFRPDGKHHILSFPGKYNGFLMSAANHIEKLFGCNGAHSLPRMGIRDKINGFTGDAETLVEACHIPYSVPFA